MKPFSRIVSLALLAAWPVLGQNTGSTNVGAANPLSERVQSPRQAPAGQVTNYQASAPAASTNLAPTSDVVASSEKPAVMITAQGTVLNDEQRRLISQKLQEIPGVVVITNRIRVVGEISEAAGAGRTNRTLNRPPTRTYHRSSGGPKSF